MQAAILTVGDELLAGETENTNATWLGRELTERGVSVARSLTLPDDRAAIAEWVRRWWDEYDAVLVTGGLGQTPDDVTMAAVADAFDTGMAVDPGVLETVERKAAAFVEDNPELAAEYEMDVDLEAVASIPDGGRPIPNGEGFGPGCVLQNVYVFPGIPREMHAMFETVADAFGGDRVSATLWTSAPEGALLQTLSAAGERFDVTVGSYPSDRGEPARVTVTGTDDEAVAAAREWLEDRIELTDPPDGPE